MPTRAIVCSWTLIFVAGMAAAADTARPRLIVLTDIGGDPDDQQSMVRLMTYANEFEIEGLIASASGTPGELKENVVRPDLIRQIVNAYGAVRDNLARHAGGYPAASTLLEKVKQGNPLRGQAHIGDGHDTEGSRWIMAVVDRPDPRPVNVCIWGGPTELAQALWSVRHRRQPAEQEQFLAKLRVYAIGHQDDTGPWIVDNFPQLFYVLGMSPPGMDKRLAVYRGMYLGGDESLTSRQWIETNVRQGHGPLGALYPTKTWTAPNPHGVLKEGDTPSWFYFLPLGLNDPARPEWGGWGGRFQREQGNLYRDAPDAVDNEADPRAGVWRWRPYYQADWQARMDWCVRSPSDANHRPVAVVDGDRSSAVLRRPARAGEVIRLDADRSSDPDGDLIAYRWSVYAAAGTYRGAVAVEQADTPRAEVAVPVGAAGRSIHVLLQISDDGEPPLTAWRRVVIEVSD